MSAPSIAPTIPPPMPEIDFPTWLPAMLVKELRQGLRTKGFVVAFVGFQALMALLMMGAVGSAGATSPVTRATTQSMIDGFFWTLLTVQLVFVTPSRALGSLQPEIESRSLDLLLLTRLSAWRIVFGKWASLVAQSLLLLVAMLPYGIVRYFAGAADLVSDAGVCLALLGCCAVLTAAGLWSSGNSKVVRIGVGILVSFAVGTVIIPGLRGGAFSRPSLASTSISMICLDGALVLAFFLIAAVRRIAPLAENYAFFARALPLVALMPVPLWALGRATSVAEGQFIFASCFVLLVCGAELASVQLPMAVHLRPWLERGKLGKAVARFVLPGWQSGLIYAMVAIALPALIVLGVPRVVPATVALRMGWLALLALGALAFPIVGISFFERSAARSAASLYVLLIAVMSAFAATGAALNAGFPLKYGWLQEFARMLPVSGFWLSLGTQDLSESTMVVQAALVIVVLGFAWWQAHPYWRHIENLKARERMAKL